MAKPLILTIGQVWQRFEEPPLRIIEIKGDVVYLYPIDNQFGQTYVVSSVEAMLTQERWKFIK